MSTAMRARATMVLCLAIAGCGSSSDGNGGNTPQATLVGAQGVTITQVAIYQGPKRVLMQDGASQPSSEPLVAGRPGILRIFHQTDASYDGGPVIVRLDRPGLDPVETEVPTLTPATVDEDISSGIGFTLDGATIGSTFDYTVGFYRAGDAANDNPAARWGESVPVEGHENKLRVRLVPYRYDADGSGRVPNTGPEQVEKIREKFLQLYPVSDVEVTVHDPVPWSSQLGKDGSGWQALGFNLLGVKNQEALGDDVYDYAIFNPAGNLLAYCGNSCLLGVTLLNDNPPDTGTPQLRLALGVGFEEVADNTCAHETGHAHGRDHVNCGFGLDPASIDHAYPYDTHTIGVWSWDIVNNVLIDPNTHTDIMGYCDDQWISDYNYGKLFTRTQNVNLPSYELPNGPPEYDVVAFDGLGGVDFLDHVHQSRPIEGRKLRVATRDRNGAKHEVEATFLRYDHLNGGWLFLPPGEATEVELELDGKKLIAKRDAARMH
jgi:hypothetical protein